METSSALAGAGSDPLIGAVVAGRYRIEESIGAGQMARVYRARHLRLSRSFAVKVLPGPRASDPVMRLRFAQEADAASSLDHPNVVSVVDFGRIDSGELYLVMELVEGESLGDLIAREGALDPGRAIPLARALARGLGHAHERGLVHRDFKPDNVVLERAAGGELLPRILDFGLAIRCEPAEGEVRLTEEGFVVGTPIYLAPEQACAEPVDARADLYALGVVLYEMLAGQPPFDGHPVEVARRKLVEPPPPIARRNPEAALPAGLEAVVRRLLAQDPDDRFQSAGELVAALDAVETGLAHAPARAEPLPARTRPPPPGSRRQRLALAAAVVVSLVAGGVSLEVDPPAPPAAPSGPPPYPPPPAPAPARTEVPPPPTPALARTEVPPPPPPRASPRRAARRDELAHLARQYREVGEALDRLHATRGAAAAAPLEARYLRLSYADALRVPALRRETLARLAALRRDILRAAE